MASSRRESQMWERKCGAWLIPIGPHGTTTARGQWELVQSSLMQQQWRAWMFNGLLYREKTHIWQRVTQLSGWEETEDVIYTWYCLRKMKGAAHTAWARVSLPVTMQPDWCSRSIFTYPPVLESYCETKHCKLPRCLIQYGSLTVLVASSVYTTR